MSYSLSQLESIYGMSRKAREKRCAPAPWTFNGRFSIYDNVGKFQDLTLERLLKVPDLLARAEESGCEACYVEVARWSSLRDRWERFAFEKCFGGEIKEFPDLGDKATCTMIAEFINARMGTATACLFHSFPNLHSI